MHPVTFRPLWYWPKLVVKTARRWQRLGRVADGFRAWPYGFIALAIAAFVLLCQHVGVLQPFELSIYDTWVRFQSGMVFTQTLRPHPANPDKIVVVGITEADIAAVGQWPIPDQTLAALLAKLQQQGVRMIGLDLYREIHYPPGEAALDEQLKADNLVAIESLIDGIPAPPETPAARVGFNDFVVDSDGVVRRSLVYAQLDQVPFYALSLQMARRLLDITVVADAHGLQLGSIWLPALVPDAGGYRAADTAGYQTLLQYGRAVEFTQVSMMAVLQDRVDPSWLKDAIVLVGSVAASTKDVFFTPYSPALANPTLPGVQLHAHSLNQLLGLIQGRQVSLRVWLAWQEHLWVLGWAIAGGVIAWRYRHPLTMVGWAGGVIAGLAAVTYWAYGHGVWLLFVAPGLACGLTLAVTATYKVFYSSFYDALTRLPNRALLLKRLQRRLDQSGRSPQATLAVLFLDIDGFKSINESLGSDGGNQILRLMAQRLRRAVPEALVARVGSDEFAVVLPKIDHSQQAVQTADHLQKCLSAPSPTASGPLIATVSAGIALHPLGDRHRATDLLQDAHRATYRARQLGKERYEVFARGMRTQAVSQFQLERDLRQALTLGQFELYYQPIVLLDSGQISGFEALLRWHHPERGFVSPAEFVPIAEETGLIEPLGQWILHSACVQLRQWHQTFSSETPQTPPLFVSVNLSGRQFAQSSLIAQIEQILATTQVNRQGLKLELTESIAMENVATAIDQLVRLKQMGLHLSLDDFGTGYSSLSYLHRFPLDTLKVDRSFVGRMEIASEDWEIVSTVIALGHKLKMTVVAEGIETPKQLQLLRSLQCDYGQGYLFAKPLPADQATALLHRAPRW